MSRLDTATRVELRDLVDRYAGLVDERRTVAAAELFIPDGVLVAPDPPQHLAATVEHHGRAQIQQALDALGGFTATFHAVHGAVFDSAGTDPDGPDRALGRVSATAHHLSTGDDGSPRDLVWQLVYRDAYQRTEQGWRIARRELHLTSVGAGRIFAIGTPEAAPGAATEGAEG